MERMRTPDSHGRDAEISATMRVPKNGQVTIATQARNVEENVLHAVVRHDEPETLCHSNHLITPVNLDQSTASPKNSSKSATVFDDILSPLLPTPQYAPLTGQLIPYQEINIAVTVVRKCSFQFPCWFFRSQALPKADRVSSKTFPSVAKTFMVSSEAKCYI